MERSSIREMHPSLDGELREKGAWQVDGYVKILRELFGGRCCVGEAEGGSASARAPCDLFAARADGKGGWLNGGRAGAR